MSLKSEKSAAVMMSIKEEEEEEYRFSLGSVD